MENNYLIEKKIYELLGIKYFRSLVFKLEKALHRKDHGKNTNYHLPSNTITGMKAFIKYFFYNGAIHVRNIAILFAYIIFRVIYFRAFRVYDIIIIPFLIKDIYCVMLQRYNYIRLKERSSKLEIRRKERINQRAIQLCFDNYQDAEIKKADELVKRIKTAIENNENIIISNEDILTLKMLTETLRKTVQE